MPELKHKYFVFKLSSEFNIVRLKQKLDLRMNETHRNFVSGKELAHILLEEEWKKKE